MARVESLNTAGILAAIADQAVVDDGLYASIDEPIAVAAVDVEEAARIAADALRAPISSIFLPTTAYKAGQLIVNSSGVLYSCKVDFTSGATFSITNWNVVTPAGPTPVANAAARDALALYEGRSVYRIDTHTIETYNGTAWRGVLATPLAKIQHASVSIPNAVTTNLVAWNTFVKTTGGMVGQASGVKVPVAGEYAVGGVIHWSGNATGRRGVYIVVNTVSDPHLQTFGPSVVATLLHTGTPPGFVTCAANDVITLAAYQDSTVANSITAELDVWQIA